jgi:hypothetical protein
MRIDGNTSLSINLLLRRFFRPVGLLMRQLMLLPSIKGMKWRRHFLVMVMIMGVMFSLVIIVTSGCLRRWGAIVEFVLLAGSGILISGLRV